jgi:hypothetical protein
LKAMENMVFETTDPDVRLKQMRERLNAAGIAAGGLGGVDLGYIYFAGRRLPSGEGEVEVDIGSPRWGMSRFGRNGPTRSPPAAPTKERRDWMHDYIANALDELGNKTVQIYPGREEPTGLYYALDGTFSTAKVQGLISKYTIDERLRIGGSLSG